MHARNDNSVLIERWVAAPNPVEIEIEPVVRSDGPRMADALFTLCEDDPAGSPRAGSKPESFVLGGQSEDDVAAKIDLLKQKCGVELNIIALQAAYRERLTGCIEIDHTFKKAKYGVGLFARVVLRFEPADETIDNEFRSAIPDAGLSASFLSGVTKGVRSVTVSGILEGFPVIGLKATVIGAAAHEDSSVLAFEIAARAATREALQKGGCELLEPVMRVEATAPEEYSGFIVGDMKSRRGAILENETESGAVNVIALAPLANLFGYVNQLRSGTQGRAVSTMAFNHYAPLPPHDSGPPDRFRPAVGMRLPRTRNLDL